MESIETEYRPSAPETSSTITNFSDTEINLWMLGAAVGALHRRKKAVQLELKQPGVAANKERLFGLLTELERIARALYGVRAGDPQ